MGFREAIETSRLVSGDPEVASRLLLTLGDYERWCPVFHFRGRGSSRRLLKLRLGGVPVPVPVVIECRDPAHGVRWRGGIPLLFTARHALRLEPDGEQLRLIHRETFSGLLIPLVMPLLKPALLPRYRQVNAAFEAAVNA